jgi:ABC-type antimicrobial peptide transport system permease subunit
MVFANLFRRKGRTILTMLGIGIGVAAIVALGAAAQGVRAGFGALMKGSQADVVLSRAGSLNVMMNSIDEAIADELRAWHEVADVDGILFTNAVLGDGAYVFMFGHDPDGFAIEHFRVVEGQALSDAQGARRVRGEPMLLGARAAENLDKRVGDTLRIGGTAFRVAGIYETGDGFEDSGVVISLAAAQAHSVQPRRVSMLYVQLRNPSDVDRLRARLERRYDDLSISTASGFTSQEMFFQLLEGIAMAVAGLATVIGGVVMTNTLFMSVYERTREIGLLRAVGWRRRQVLALILGESLTLAWLGGLVGAALGLGAVYAVSRSASLLGILGMQLTPGIFIRALVTVTLLGLVGGALPAWRASRLLPLEALHYEGGSEGRAPRAKRVPGGMVARNLWRQRTRTALALLGTGISIAAIVALGGVAQGMLAAFTDIMGGSGTDLLAMQANVDSDLSAIDERMAARIAARSDVETVSGMIMTGASSDEMPILLLFGYHPREWAVRRFRIVEGAPLAARHEVILGRDTAEQMGIGVGDTMRLMESRFRVVGIYETGLPFEEIGVVIGLREAQSLTGRHNQAQFYAIKLREPRRAREVQADLAAAFPEIDFAMASELAEDMSDFRVMQDIVGQISFLAVLIGALGMLNTMLMSVLERTREIGVLRALGWRRRRVLGMIVRESIALGIVGGVCGILIGLALTTVVTALPGFFSAFTPLYTPQLFVQAVATALGAGAVGGLYPAWRATRMQPVEALRYE